MVWALTFITVVFLIGFSLYSVIVVGSRSEEYHKGVERSNPAQKRAMHNKDGETFAENHNGDISGDICVLCGRYIPEGRQICPICEKK